VENFTIRLAPFEAVPLGEGRSEELIKGVIAGQRDRASVVSKVEANQVRLPSAGCAPWSRSSFRSLS
jgi:hypothetical protein